MTTEPSTPAPPAPSPTTEPSATDTRLPDDHPAAQALARANKEAETLRLKLKEIEDRDLTELERLQVQVAERDAQLADLPKQARTQAIRFASKATQAGFLDPEDALTFLADVDLADDDAVKAALADLAERKPHLVRPGEPPKKVPARPKAKAGTEGDHGAGTAPQGKERAAAALRQFRDS